MSRPEADCPFCDTETLKREQRIIRATDAVLSIVSNPSAGEFHSVIFPRRHIANSFLMDAPLRHELADERALLEQAVKDAYEERRRKLGKNTATVLIGFHKEEPTNPQNGISVYGHMHDHVLPLSRPDTSDLVPIPRHGSDFRPIPSDVLIETRDLIRGHL